MTLATGDGASAREELKVFLRARRAEVSPEAAGLPRGARRLTRGLRREEVAQLAGVGLTWYTWLEQGRDIRVSTDVLDRIAKALRLSHSDKAYLFTLAGHSLASGGNGESEIDEATKLALGSIETSPAIIVNPRFDVIASNRLAGSLLDLQGCEDQFAKNLLWRAFMDPAWIGISPVRAERLRSAVGILRSNYASRIGDPHFEELLRALREASDEFAQIWENHKTESLAPARIPIESRRLGCLTVWASGFTIPGRPGFFMIVYAPADVETAGIFEQEAARLRRDASLSAKAFS